MKKRIFIFSLFIVIVTLFFTTKVKAEDYLIKVGTGSKQITVTSDTTIAQIESVLGKAKLETESAYGGKAYTFYTDSNYSNYLYIETLDDGKIFSYGSVDPSFKTNIVSFGEERPKYSSILQGYTLTDGGKVNAGIFYNRSALFDGDFKQIREFYKKEFLDNQIKYQKGLNQQAVVMFNALSRRYNRNTNYVFEEKLYNIYAEFKNKNQSFNKFLAALKVDSDWVKELNNSSGAAFNSNNCLLNPLSLANDAYKLKDNDVNTYKYLLFDYDDSSKYETTTLINEKMYQELINKKGASYLVDQNEILYNQNIMYALSLLDDSMNEKQKASLLAAYTQSISLYRRNDNDQHYRSVFLNHASVCAGFADVLRLLTRYEGLHCETVTSSLGNHAWNMCYLDGDFTYLDNTKSVTNSNYIAPYGKYSLLGPVSKTDLLGTDPWRHVFSDAVLKDDFITEFPEGVTGNGNLSEDLVYSDDNYYYYQKQVYEKQEFSAYIFKQDKKTKKETRLTTVSKSPGIVKR